uniref:Calponin-homology (CH) domain-containing protein n=1 Tax=Strigamia maritima TaxID=126957 RepID=T1JAF1_STRMM
MDKRDTKTRHGFVWDIEMDELQPRNEDKGKLSQSSAVIEKQISELIHSLEVKTNEIAQLKLELKKFKDEEAAVYDSKFLPNDVKFGMMINPEAFSDDEKQMLLEAGNNSSNPDFSDAGVRNPSENCNSTAEDLAEALECILPSTCDWDKQSNSSISEMSVACLQDRILQMEETHYSTNEELQATLQELTDLQDQLTELQVENEHLAEGKTVLLESLCSQTEKLEDCRVENDNLRQLLFNNTQLTSCNREAKLLELLKTSRDEKETLNSHLVELRSALENVKDEAHAYSEEVAQLQEQLTVMQLNIESANTAKRILAKQSTQSREQLDNLQIEVSRTKTQLENERIKVSELHQAREIVDKSELDELLDNARKEKDDLESHAAVLSEQLAFSQFETTRLKDAMINIEEELKVTKDIAKRDVSEMEFQIDQLNAEKDKLSVEVGVFRESVHELERKCQRHLEDKRELRASICELKQIVEKSTEDVRNVEKRFEEAVSAHQLEIQEWRQFQDDLLMTVRVANDFKAEAQEELEALVLENKNLRDKIASLKAEMERNKQDSPRRNVQATTTLENLITSNAEQELSLPTSNNRRESRPLSVSVKSVIESIENATKQAKANNSGNKQNTCEKNGSNNTNPIETTESFKVTTEITKEAQYVGNDTTKYYTKLPSKQMPESMRISNIPNTQDTTDGIKHSSPISILTNKLDPMRRGSYSDILDRKDPLVSLVKGGGSKRNALLKWCQSKTIGYKGIDITNFSSSWNDGLAFCALLHTYLPDRISYDELDAKNKRRNFTVAFRAAESVGIPCNLNINEMITTERPDWQAIMTYVTAIYKHFET